MGAIKCSDRCLWIVSAVTWHVVSRNDVKVLWLFFQKRPLTQTSSNSVFILWSFEYSKWFVIVDGQLVHSRSCFYVSTFKALCAGAPSIYQLLTHPQQAIYQYLWYTEIPTPTIHIQTKMLSTTVFLYNASLYSIITHSLIAETFKSLGEYHGGWPSSLRDPCVNMRDNL